ncbi:hypothetical protein NDU88_005988 [Pleurodeles waltl]|uniref:Uncharacterized protein n=1 Tax=Pleurodeles waltl TaxID=8319 RepID=A0AAV7WD29_PLEWA|nr:hypothetical protein NDU88_005988 [Pleurodeles waltl]
MPATSGGAEEGTGELWSPIGAQLSGSRGSRGALELSARPAQAAGDSSAGPRPAGSGSAAQEALVGPGVELLGRRRRRELVVSPRRVRWCTPLAESKVSLERAATMRHGARPGSKEQAPSKQNNKEAGEAGGPRLQGRPVSTSGTGAERTWGTAPWHAGTSRGCAGGLESAPLSRVSAARCSPGRGRPLDTSGAHWTAPMPPKTSALRGSLNKERRKRILANGGGPWAGVPTGLEQRRAKGQRTPLPDWNGRLAGGFWTPQVRGGTPGSRGRGGRPIGDPRGRRTKGTVQPEWNQEGRNRKEE